MLWDLVKSFGDLLIFALLASAILTQIKNKNARNALAAIAAVLGLLWLLASLAMSVLTSNSLLLVVLLFVLLFGLMFLIHYGSKAMSKRVNTPRP